MQKRLPSGLVVDLSGLTINHLNYILMEMQGYSTNQVYDMILLEILKVNGQSVTQEFLDKMPLLDKPASIVLARIIGYGEDDTFEHPHIWHLADGSTLAHKHLIQITESDLAIKYPKFEPNEYGVISVKEGKETYFVRPLSFKEVVSESKNLSDLLTGYKFCTEKGEDLETFVSLGIASKISKKLKREETYSPVYGGVDLTFSITFPFKEIELDLTKNEATINLTLTNSPNFFWITA